MIIKAVKFRRDGFYTQPFVFGGEEGMDKFDHNIRYRGSLQNYLIDTGTEVILVDTGIPAGTPEENPDEKSLAFTGKDICSYMEALAALGYRPEQVTKILLTHRHADHSGELRSFPNAKVYVNQDEMDAAELQGLANLVPVSYTDGPYYNFPESQKIADGIYFIKAKGHTKGNSIIVVENDGLFYMLHGDITYIDEALHEDKLSVVYDDLPAARETQNRIREFVRNHPTVYCGTHTPQGYENLEAKRVMDLDNSMIRLFATGLLALITCATMWGQVVSITGEVRDAKANEPILGATVLVVGSQVGTVTDVDGRFILNIPEGKCNLQISLIGYKSQTVDVCDKQDIVIILEEDTLLLDGVVVLGTRTYTKIEGNALVTRIEGSALEEVGSLEEMLARTPGMQRNGEILEVIGKGEPEYYIDGRRIKEKVELKRLNSRQIDRVEVISNPGAEYDGEMMCIVRIYTRQNFAQGISGDITGRYENSLDYLENIDPSVTANLRYRIKNVELKAGLNFWHASVTDISTTDQQSYAESAGQSLVYRQQGEQDFRYRGYNLNYLLGVNWAINNRHTISLEAMVEQQIQDTTIVLSDNALSLNGTPLDKIHTETHTRAFAPDNGLIGGWTNTQYIGHIGKSEIGAQFDTYNYRYTERNHIDESDQTMFSITDSKSQQYNVKAYGAYTIGKGNLRVGTDMTFFHRFYTNENDLSGIAGVNEDMYRHIYAAYTEYHLDMDTCGTLVAGLRYEHEYRRFDDHLENSVSRSRENYFFPSLSYHVKIKGVQLGFSYAMKTRRPEFTETNDAIVYLNRYSLSQGNSRLKTEVKHELSLQLRYRHLACGLNYENRRRAVITDVTLLNDGSTLLFHPVNLGKPINQISAFANYTPVWGIYHPNWTLSMKTLIHRSYQPVINLSVINPLMLKNAWQVELNYNLVTTGNPEWNTRLTRCSHNLTAAIQKSFLKDNALTLRLEARDILGLTKENATTDYGCSILQQQKRHDNRRICLSLRYSL